MMYLIRHPGRRGPDSIVGLSTELFVKYTDIYRTKKIRQSPIGNIREIETAGRNKGRLDIQLRGDRQRADGGKGPYNSHVGSIPTRQSEIEKTVRVVQDADIEALAQMDERIEEKRRELRALKQEREEFVRTQVWKRAVAPALPRLLEIADAWEEEHPVRND